MRTLSATLTTAQKFKTINPLWKIVLSSGATTHTYEKDRVIAIIPHTREAFSHKATVLLDNSDGVLTDLALEGYQGVISYGMITKAGEEYDAQPPLTVIAQETDSSPGVLTCTLELIGIPNMLAEDRASTSYIPASSDTKTVKTIINDMFDGTMAAYSHCETYTVDWDSADDLIDAYTPKDGFRIYKGGTRLAALRRLLDYTKCVAIFDADGHITIINPTVSGSTYDYEYKLDVAGEHTFFAKAYRKRLVIPNKIQIDTDPDADTPYTGSAVDAASYAALGHYITQFETAHLDNDAQGDDIAEAMMLKYQLNAEAGAGSVPINVGAEVYDYVKITDSREDDNRVGNIGKIVINIDTRGKTPKWEMRFSFGGWLSVRQRINELETYPSGIGSAGQYFSRLSAKDCFIENLQADNILLYTMDDISNGETYSRVRALNLLAEGLTVSDDTLYYINYNPEDGEKTFLKAASAPTDPAPAAGDFWLDTSGESDILKRYSGSAWVEATAEQKVAILGGTLYRRSKSASLTAGGLIILDQVSGTFDDINEGTTYQRVLATQISAGKISLTSTGFLIDEDHVTAKAGAVEIDGAEGIVMIDTDIDFYDGASYMGGLGYFSTTADLRLYSSTNYGVRIESIADDIELEAGGNDIFPHDTAIDLGTASLYFDDVNYTDLIDRTPSPMKIDSALGKLKGLKTHISSKERKGIGEVTFEAFDRDSMPAELLRPVTQRDKDKAKKHYESQVKIVNAYPLELDKAKQKLREYELIAKEKPKLLRSVNRLRQRIAIMETEPPEPVTYHEPQVGISMNAQIGFIYSCLKELTDKVEALEAG